MVYSNMPDVELDAGMIMGGSSVEIASRSYYGGNDGALHVTLPEMARSLHAAGTTHPLGTGHFAMNSLEIIARLHNKTEYVIVIHGDIGLPLCSFTMADRGTVEFSDGTVEKILNGNLPPYDREIPMFPVEYPLHNSSLLCLNGGMLRNYGVYMPLSEARKSVSGAYADLQDLIRSPLAVARAGVDGLRGLFYTAGRRRGCVVNLHRLDDTDERCSFGYLLRLNIDDFPGTTVTIDGTYHDYDCFRFVAVNDRSTKSPQQYSR